MAKKRKRKGESLSAYFKQVFNDQPELLYEKSNAEILQRYKVDHPNEDITPRIKQNLANTKSALRKVEREGEAGGKTTARQAAAKTSPENSRSIDLEKLEVAIDDCMTIAKNIDRRSLHHAIESLRHARNLVVWKSGK